MMDREDCEDEGKEDDEICSTQRDLEELRRKLKAPDRGKFDRELDRINTAIRDLEAKFRSLQSSHLQSSLSSNEGKDRESLMNELRGFKAEREKEIDIRKKIDQELKGVNITVQQKNDTCGRLQASLKYKTEARADEAIRRLEHQLRVQQLKLREEKRLVTEIDTLKRSKKQIHEFDALKQEIALLRDKQNALRKQRDICIKTIAKLKSKEEEIKLSLDEQRFKTGEVKQQKIGYNIEKNALKKDIDELYTRKRSLLSTYHKEKEEYYALLKDIREHEKRIKKEAEAIKRIEEQHQHRKQHNNDGSSQCFMNAAHEKMLGVCDSLIQYINGLNVGNKTEEHEATPDQHTQAPQNTDSQFSGGTFLKKKTDDDLEEMYGAVAGKKAGRRGSKKGKKAAQKENVPKKLVLHPLVLDQFLSVHIIPPSTAADIPKVLELLIEKKTNLFTAIDAPEAAPMSPSSSSSSSLENFPSLPSQQDSSSEMDVHLHKKEDVKKKEGKLENHVVLDEEDTSGLCQQQQKDEVQQQCQQQQKDEVQQQCQQQQKDEVQQQCQQQKDEVQQHCQQQKDEVQQQCQQQKDEVQQQYQNQEQQQQGHEQQDEEDQQTLKQTQQSLPLDEAISAVDQSENQVDTQEEKKNLKQHSSNNAYCSETEEVYDIKNKINSQDSNISLNYQETSSLHSAKKLENASTNSNHDSTSNNEDHSLDANHVVEENSDENIASDLKEKSKDSGINGDHMTMVSESLPTNSSNNANSSIKCPS